MGLLGMIAFAAPDDDLAKLSFDVDLDDLPSTMNKVLL